MAPSGHKTLCIKVCLASCVLHTSVREDVSLCIIHAYMSEQIWICPFPEIFLRLWRDSLSSHQGEILNELNYISNCVISIRPELTY